MAVIVEETALLIFKHKPTIFNKQPQLYTVWHTAKWKCLYISEDVYSGATEAHVGSSRVSCVRVPPREAHFSLKSVLFWVSLICTCFAATTL